MLDDLHAADEPSLLLLQFVARHVRAAPLLIAGAYRDIEAEPGTTLAAVAAELHASARFIKSRWLDSTRSRLDC